jgi:hypothetical protein
MGVSVCPADTVEAPVEVVWEIMTQPAYYSTWADARLEHIEPNAPAVEGQVIHFTSRALGRTWPFVFTVQKVNAEKHQLDLSAIFPLGIRMQPHISCTPLSATTSLLRYG